MVTTNRELAALSLLVNRSVLLAAGHDVAVREPQNAQQRDRRSCNGKFLHREASSQRLTRDAGTPFSHAHEIFNGCDGCNPMSCSCWDPSLSVVMTLQTKT
jgi:hypothetical protein